MAESIDINDIHDKRINFLIGSGASFGLFPTLALNIKDNDSVQQTIETLATTLEQGSDRYTLLFMHYYKTCIEPVLLFDLDTARADAVQLAVLNNYSKFITTLLTILRRRKNEKSCNVFTTNYDGCFVHLADEILRTGTIDFVVNDGARGFSRRYLQAKNFNNYVYQSGVFERHHTDIPQINLVHLHGSAYWYRDEESILVDYVKENDARKITGDYFDSLSDFSNVLLDGSKVISDLPEVYLDDEEKDGFWDSYNQLPIVNPTKWKFHETVFEEHYYQMLRLLSYELEKPNSVFISFGFSFADEHIRNLVKRSLSNPSLQLFICKRSFQHILPAPQFPL